MKKIKIEITTIKWEIKLKKNFFTSLIDFQRQ